MITDIINIALYVNDKIVESRIASIDDYLSNDSYLNLRNVLTGIQLMSSCNFDQVVGFAKMVPFSDGDLLKIISDEDATKKEQFLLQKAIPYDDALNELMDFAEEYEKKIHYRIN